MTVTATCGDNTQSFQLTAEVPDFALKLKIDDKDYTGKTYQTPGSGEFSLVPYAVVDGKEREANYGLFNWSSNASDIINVDSTGWVNVKQEGTAVLTAELNGVSASVTVKAGYTPITGIECAFDGTYTIHRRNPNSIGQNGTPGIASFNPLRHLKDGEEWVGSEHHIANITPEDATYAGSYDITTNDKTVMEFQGSLVQSLIPMKAGTVNVTVTTKDPKLGKQLSDTNSVTLEYLNPLQSLTAKSTELTVKVGETIDAGLIFKGENDNAWPKKYPAGLHVSESYITWEQSGDGKVSAYRSYPVIMQGDEEFSLEEGTVSNDQWLIKGVAEGTVTLKGTAQDTTNGVQTITLTIHVEAGDQKPELPVVGRISEALQKTAAYQLSILAEKTPAFLDEWSILGLARAGYAVPENFFELYYGSVYETARQEHDKSADRWDNKVTETQRLALALTAIGKDPRYVNGVNLLDYSWNKSTNFPGSGGALGDRQGSNELIFGLLAIEANSAFEQPDSVEMTKEQMVDKLLRNFYIAGGGFGLYDNTTISVDMTAMALQALAKHQDRQDVKSAIDTSLTRLSQMQGIDGSYGNAESTAQVVLALCELGIDPHTDERFNGNGVSPVDALLQYARDDGSFSHTLGGDANGMSTEQALYTLAGVQRFYEKQNSLYEYE